MRIAFNTRFLLDNYLEGYGHFLREVLQRLTQNHPEHEFIFIFDRPFDEKFLFNKNVIPVIAGPPARHPLLWKWWFDVKVAAMLKKYKADVFVSSDGFCSLTTKTPQLLVLHDLAFLHHPSFIKKSHLFFYKRYTPKFLKKAASIVTVSEFSKKDILSHYPVDAGKISVIYNAPRQIFRPLTDEVKQQTLEAYTGGKNYFIYAGAIHPRKNLVNLLKAFSIFKKRQRSDWKLVLAGRLAWKNDPFLESLKRYKYRDDVLITGYLGETELAQLIGSAYALIYPSVWEGFGMPVVEAIASDVPVITSLGSAMQEIAGDAALYAEPANPADLADKMMLLYKDESLRNQLIEKGRQVNKRYSWDRSAEELWGLVQGLIGD